MGASSHVGHLAPLKDVLHGLLDHALLKGIVELLGHAGLEGTSGSTKQSLGFAEIPSETTNCLRSFTLLRRQAATELLSRSASHAKLCTETTLQGADPATQSAGCFPDASTKLSCGAASDLLNLAQAATKLACGTLCNTHALSDVAAKLVVDATADPLNATQGLTELACCLLGCTLRCGDLSTEGAGCCSLLCTQTSKLATQSCLGANGALLRLLQCAL